MPNEPTTHDKRAMPDEPAAPDDDSTRRSLENAGNSRENTEQDARLVAFESMARGRNEVMIEYQGQVYRLRATRNGKLILNK